MNTPHFAIMKTFILSVYSGAYSDMTNNLISTPGAEPTIFWPKPWTIDVEWTDMFQSWSDLVYEVNIGKYSNDLLSSSRYII